MYYLYTIVPDHHTNNTVCARHITWTHVEIETTLCYIYTCFRYCIMWFMKLN